MQRWTVKGVLSGEWKLGDYYFGGRLVKWESGSEILDLMVKEVLIEVTERERE